MVLSLICLQNLLDVLQFCKQMLVFLQARRAHDTSGKNRRRTELLKRARFQLS